MVRDPLLLFVLSSLLVPTLAFADEADGDQELEKHVVAFFVGYAQEGTRDDGTALGVEYEYRSSDRFGIGALLEHSFGDLDTWVFAIPLAYHTGPWKLYVAPGVEDGEDSEAMLRIGAEHGFEVGEWEIAPQIDVDFVDGEETWVIGVVFGRGL